MGAGVITALEIHKRNKERVSVYLDGEYAFSLSLIEAAKLRKGQALTAAEVDRLRAADLVDQAVDRAVHFLRFRPRSAAEVRRNLSEKQFPQTVVTAALERLAMLGYVDDAAFARYWVENRSEFKPISPAALRYELRQKGVDEAIIADVLEGLDAEMLAYRAGLKLARRLRPRSRQEFRARLESFLQRRGFAYTIIRDTVARLIEESEAQEPSLFSSLDESDEE